MDKLTSMKVFTAVARTGSFSAAAQELNLSKAMASKHIRYLENLLGARLLNRSNRRLSLTEVGLLYREKCQQILEDIEQTELVITELNAEPRGALKVNAPTSLGIFHLTPAIADYQVLYPAVKVKLLLSEQPMDLVEQGLDLAVRVGRLSDSNLIARKLASVDLVVCGAPTYFESRGIPQVPSDLVHHNCLVYTQWTPKGEWLFKGPEGEYSVRVSGDFQASLGEAIRIAAIQGRGLVQLATYMVGQDLKMGRLQAVLTDYQPDEFPIYVVYPHRRHLSATVRSFVEFISARFQSRSYWDKY